jgi:SAM-dependent methyltransferase
MVAKSIGDLHIAARGVELFVGSMIRDCLKRGAVIRGPTAAARFCTMRATRCSPVWPASCGCGAPTLEFARAAGPSGRVAGLDISGPMLAEGERRASAAGIANVDWRQADPATAALDEYDLLISAFGVMFFGDRVAAFTNMRRAAAPDARMALVFWRSLAENPWMEVPMTAAAQHLPPRPKPVPNAPGMFAFADRDHVTEVVTAAGWAPPRFERHGPRYRRRPRVGGGCGAVNPNRRREQLVA